MPRGPALRALALAAALAALGGCKRAEDPAEADRVLRAIDLLRDSPADALDARDRLVAELAALPAEGPDVARARDDCAKAYRLLVEGRRLEIHVRAELEKPSDPNPALAGDLIQAEAKVKGSAAVMPDCERAIARLHDKLRR